MKNLTAAEIEKIKAEYSKVPQFSTDNMHEAVICSSREFYTTKTIIAVNFWTPEEIKKGQRDTRQQHQRLICKLY